MTGAPTRHETASTPGDDLPNPTDRSGSARPWRAGGLRGTALALLIALVPAVLAACGNESNGGSVNPEEQLRARPSFEQSEADYLALLDETRGSISAIVPSLQWSTPKSAQVDRAMCSAPFTKIPGADTGIYEAGTGKGGIPDADWPRVVQAVTEIAKKHGFTTVTPLVSTTGRHVLDIHGPWGATLELGSKVNTTLGVLGACFLHQNARSGVPTPTGA